MKPRVAVPVVIPLTVNEGSPSPTFSSAVILSCLVDLSCSDWVEMKHQSFNEFFFKVFLSYSYFIF